MVDIRGFLPVSLIEYPGKISSVVFTGGCNLRCPFCHNKDLVIGLDNAEKIADNDLINQIKKKKEWIDAVCFTGGEPTLNVDLPLLFKRIKEVDGADLSIMLETNGTNPEMVKQLIDNKLVDRVAMDIKAPFGDYAKLGASDEMIEKIKQSIEIILKEENNCISAEFRITAAPDIVMSDNIKKIGQQIAGAKKIALQQFRPMVTLDPEWQKKKAHTDDVLKKMADDLKEFAEEVEIR